MNMTRRAAVAGGASVLAGWTLWHPGTKEGEPDETKRKRKHVAQPGSRNYVNDIDGRVLQELRGRPECKAFGDERLKRLVALWGTTAADVQRRHGVGGLVILEAFPNAAELLQDSATFQRVAEFVSASSGGNSWGNDSVNHWSAILPTLARQGRLSRPTRSSARSDFLRANVPGALTALIGRHSDEERQAIDKFGDPAARILELAQVTKCRPSRSVARTLLRFGDTIIPACQTEGPAVAFAVTPDPAYERRKLRGEEFYQRTALEQGVALDTSTVGLLTGNLTTVDTALQAGIDSTSLARGMERVLALAGSERVAALTDPWSITLHSFERDRRAVGSELAGEYPALALGLMHRYSQTCPHLISHTMEVACDALDATDGESIVRPLLQHYEDESFLRLLRRFADERTPMVVQQAALKLVDLRKSEVLARLASSGNLAGQVGYFESPPSSWWPGKNTYLHWKLASSGVDITWGEWGWTVVDDIGLVALGIAALTFVFGFVPTSIAAAASAAVTSVVPAAVCAWAVGAAAVVTAVDEMLLPASLIHSGLAVGQMFNIGFTPEPLRPSLAQILAYEDELLVPQAYQSLDEWLLGNQL